MTLFSVVILALVIVLVVVVASLHSSGSGD